MAKISARSPSPAAKRRAALADALLERIRQCPWQTARELLAGLNLQRRRKVTAAALVGPLRRLRGLDPRGGALAAPRVQVSGQRSATRYAPVGCTTPPPPRFRAPGQ